jgi:hypothetical protein
MLRPLKKFQNTSTRERKRKKIKKECEIELEMGLRCFGLRTWREKNN